MDFTELSSDLFLKSKSDIKYSLSLNQIENSESEDFPKSGEHEKVMIFRGKWLDNLPTFKTSAFIEKDRFKNFEFKGVFGERLDIVCDEKDRIFFGERNQNGEFHGRGTCQYPEGVTYVGDFRQNIWSGSGKLYGKKKLIYEGQFFQGTLEGKGRFHFNDGNRYEGRFHNGEMEGQGSIFYRNGKKFEGLFVKSKKQGPGRMTFQSGGYLEGTYEDDALEGRALYVRVKKKKLKEYYEREYSNGKMTLNKRTFKFHSKKKTCCAIF